MLKKMRLGLVAAVAAVGFASTTLVAPASAATNPVFDPSSTVTFTHTADAANPGLATPVSLTVKPPAGLPTAFQFAHRFVNNGVGGNTSATSAAAEIGEISNQTTTTLLLGTGTGIAQRNIPGLVYTGASVLNVAVNAKWTLPPVYPIGGPPLAFFTLPVGGIVGISGTDRVIVHLKVEQFTGAIPTVLASLDDDKTYTNPSSTTPLPFTDTLVESQLFAGLNTLKPLVVTGTIQFRAKNDQSPSNINLNGPGEFGVKALPLPPAWAMGLGGLALAALAPRALRRGAC